MDTRQSAVATAQAAGEPHTFPRRPICPPATALQRPECELRRLGKIERLSLRQGGRWEGAADELDRDYSTTHAHAIQCATAPAETSLGTLGLTVTMHDSCRHAAGCAK